MVVGERVSVAEDGVIYPGEIVKVNNKAGTYDVTFDNGDEGVYTESEFYVEPELPSITPTPTKAKPAKPVLSQEELERKVDQDRKAGVDATNKKMAENIEDQDAKLAGVPLTAEEKEFMARIKPRMNYGRRGQMPSAADITRYARLVKRL